MAKLNPTAPVRATIASGLVLEELHGALFRTLAARADLDPGSQQLLVGGIGSGKTTELLMAEKWLEQQGQALSVYIDISAETDLSGLNSGALLAGLGLHLTKAVSNFPATDDAAEKKALKDAGREVKEFAYGKTETEWVAAEEYDPGQDDYDPSEDFEPGHYITRNTPGKLKPPFPAMQRDIQGIRTPLERLIKHVHSGQRDVVVIFDGLDRLLTPDRFWAVVHQDFRALRQNGRRGPSRCAVVDPLWSGACCLGVFRSCSSHTDAPFRA